MRRDYSFDFDEEEKQTFSTHRLNMHPVIEPVKKGPMFTRGQMTSMVLAVALLVYALIGWDVPLAFLMLLTGLSFVPKARQQEMETQLAEDIEGDFVPVFRFAIVQLVCALAGLLVMAALR